MREFKNGDVSGQHRWMLLGFLFSGGLINYLDRSALSVAAPIVTRDLHLNPTQLGMVFSIFFAGYAVAAFLGGCGADAFGPKRVFTISMTVWSLFSGLTAAATGFVSLLIVRTIFGLGEGPFSTAANKIINSSFPSSQRGLAIGLANAGTPIGGATSSLLVGWLMVLYGWRVSFVAIAVIGFTWTAVWVRYQIRRGNNKDSRSMVHEPARTNSDRTKTQFVRRELLFYLRQRAVIVLAVAFFGYGYVLYFFLTWFPSYLTNVQHLSLRAMALLNSIPWVLGAAGLTLSGFLSDFLCVRIARDHLFGRKFVLVSGLGSAAICVAFAGIASGVIAVIALMSAAVFLVYLTGTTYWAIVQEIVQSQYVGATGGFVHLIANCAGIVGPILTGVIFQFSGSFRPAFFLAGAFAFFGACLVAIFVRRIEIPMPTDRIGVKQMC